MNIKLLKAKMVLQDVNVKKMAKTLDVKPNTVYRKLNGGLQFTKKDIETIIKVLGLTDQEACEIFFEQKVS